MRITYPSNVCLSDPDSHPLVFKGEGGDLFLITILENDLIRVQHLPDGTPRLERTWMVLGFERKENLAHNDIPLGGRQRSDLTPFSLPSFDTEVLSEKYVINLEFFRIEIKIRDFSIKWLDIQNNKFAADLEGRAYPFDLKSKTIYHYMERRLDEHYYGFGERSGPLDKYGKRIRMFNLDTMGYNAKTSDPLYKHFPFYITFIPDLNISYGIFYDNLATTIFDLGKEVDNYYPAYRYYQAENGDIDYYFIFGPSIQEVVQKFSSLTGRMALPPRWSIGYLGSTMTYTEAPDAQEQLQNFVKLCKHHKIPCDLFHLSSGYGSSD
jgi:alpha-glucosidase